MKAILRSVRPQWLAKILTGEKTAEIGKTMPKCELPIEVYLYCTKFKNERRRIEVMVPSGACGGIPHFRQISLYGGKVAAKFTLREIDVVRNCGNSFSVPDKGISYTNRIATASCLDFDDMRKYANGRTHVCAWHITDLVVFDKPMELRDFKNTNDRYVHNGVEHIGNLRRAPQTWQYVEVTK